MSIEAGIGLPAAVAPGVYPAAGGQTNLRYWNGSAWDPRPVAKTWTRVWCNVIDNLAATLVWFALGTVAALLVDLASGGQVFGVEGNPLASLVSISALVVSFVGYFAVSYRLWGRTPGMMLGRLHVVHIPSGESRLSWGTAIGRAMGLILGYACGAMTLIWLLVTASSRTKQGPHDSWAHTCVLTSAGLGPVYPTGGRSPAASRDLTAATGTTVGSVAATGAPVQDPAPIDPVPQGLHPPAAQPRDIQPRDVHPQAQTAAPQPVTSAVPEPAVVPVPAATPVPEQQSPLQEAPPQQQEAAPEPMIATSAAAPRSSRPRSRRRGLIIGLAVGGVLAILAVLAIAVAVDSRLRTNETEALLEATRQADETIRDYWDDEGFVEASDELRRLQGLTIATQQSNDDAWRDFIYEITALATSHVRPIQDRVLDVEEVPVLPWHTDIRQAQQAYLEHAEVWLDAVTARSEYTTADREVLDPLEGRDGDLVATRTVAERRFESISYPFMPAELRQDIRRHFTSYWLPNWS